MSNFLSYLNKTFCSLLDYPYASMLFVKQRTPVSILLIVMFFSHQLLFIR